LESTLDQVFSLHSENLQEVLFVENSMSLSELLSYSLLPFFPQFNFGIFARKLADSLLEPLSTTRYRWNKFG
jgi:hypothetical protein